MSMHKDKFLAQMGHRNWKIGDSFVALDGSKWVVSDGHYMTEDGTVATCFEGGLAGHTQHLSKIRLK
jgi:hypothetical protein